jgi:site-specific recombinase XerD
MSCYRSVTTDNTLVTYTERLASELERSGNRRTAKAYRTAVYRLQQFSGHPRLGFEHLTAGLVSDFQQALKANGRSMNTISFYMRTLRAIYNKAVGEGRAGHHGESPFTRVYTGVPATRKLALSASELACLSALDPTDPDTVRAGRQELPEHLAQGLAMFLFCYHARGMCFVDMANLKKADVADDTIRYRRSKTGQAIELTILPPMRRIIDWFAQRNAGSRYLFPIVDEAGGDAALQYESGLRLQNMRLKKIAAMCGISRKLSTHSARHSWATVAKNAGLPLAVISEGLGHSNQRTTEIYLASLERSVLDRASQVVSEAIVPERKRGPAEKKSSGALYYKNLYISLPRTETKKR